MSWYTIYYAGYRTKSDGKIRLLGPYDVNGKLYPIATLSRSFTSDLKKTFYPITDEIIGENLLEGLRKEYDDDKGETYKWLKQYLGYLPVKEFGSSNYFKSGYFLNSDINAYEQTDGENAEFYCPLSPQEYARMLEIERKFGVQEKAIDDFGEEYTPYSCRDYSWYCYPDYQCKEYETFLLLTAMNMFDDFKLCHEDVDLVVIKTEG